MNARAIALGFAIGSTVTAVGACQLVGGIDTIELATGDASVSGEASVSGDGSNSADGGTGSEVGVIAPAGDAGGCVLSRGTCVKHGDYVGGGRCLDGALVTCGIEDGPCCTGVPPRPDFCEDGATTCVDIGGQKKCLPCGGTGQPCCAANVESLGCFEGCCNPSTKLCVDFNQPCGSGTCASGGACGICGGMEQACCSANACNDPRLTCSSGQCDICGEMTQPCCGVPGGTFCISNDSVCDPVGQIDCVQCGGEGEPCCNGPRGQCDVGACGDDGRCHSTGGCGGCGGTGEPCCGDVCAEGNCCDKDLSGTSKCVAAGAKCSDGSSCNASDRLCKCGLPNHECCGTQCQSGCCTAGNCVANGGDCSGSQPHRVCLKDMCTSCGTIGDVCCAGGFVVDSDACCDPLNGMVIALGQACMGPSTACTKVGSSSSCTACGALGETCCNMQCKEATCPDGGVCTLQCAADGGCVYP